MLKTKGDYPTYQCQFDKNKSFTTVNSWRNIPMGSELSLQQAVALVGPVAVAINASQLFQV